MRQINRFDRLTLLAMSLGLMAITPEAQAQSIIANDRTGTIVNVNGNQFTITKGTASGQNLFHSFQKFDLPSGKATFEVPGGIQNILARVTGGNASLIQGQLAVNGANLYFMNPAGVIFGKGASLDITGAFVTTTANGIGFSNGKWFSAAGENNYAELTGTPTQFAFTEKQAGSIVQAETGYDSQNETINFSLRSQPIALIGGTVFVPNSWITNGAVVLATVSGRQIVTLTLPGENLALSLKVNPLDFGQYRLNRWTIPVQDLPTLLTGPGIQNATQIQVNLDGTVSLTTPSSDPNFRLAIQPGDIVIHSLKTPWSGNASISNKYRNAIMIDSQNTFRIFDVLDSNSRLPTSIRAVGEITIRHGGETNFVHGIGYERDTKGIVFKSESNRRVVFAGKGFGGSIFKYEDGGTSIMENFAPIVDPNFNPSQKSEAQNYSKGLIILQNPSGNGALIGVLQESSLPGSQDIQVSQGSRLAGTAEPPIDLATLTPNRLCPTEVEPIVTASRGTSPSTQTGATCNPRSIAAPSPMPILKVESTINESLKTIPQITP
jgi:filamentous hemagglutinin family protein